MTNSISVVMIGASGAVGGQVVKALADRAELGRLTLLNRRLLDLPTDARIEQHQVDLARSESYAALLAGHDAAICTLGVGEPSKISKEEFARIDHDIPLAFATACRAAGIQEFALLSSVGANANAPNFYLGQKGRLEKALTALGFDRLALFHPSMILTPTNRYGIFQAFALKAWPLLQPFLMGPLRRFRGIKVDHLGRAIAMQVLGWGMGEDILVWDDFMRLQALEVPEPGVLARGARTRPGCPPGLLPLNDAAIARRLPLWMALGDFYLDTQFDDLLPYVVSVAKKAGFTPDEVDYILRWEVRPALYFNLLSLAGEWSAWDQDWLRDQILATMAKRSPPLRDASSFIPPQWAEAQVALAQEAPLGFNLNCRPRFGGQDSKSAERVSREKTGKNRRG